MPELPEVQTVVNTLAPRIVGQRISRVEVVRADVIRPAEIDLARRVTDRSVTAIVRRGKRIVVTIDSDDVFYFHLGMTGRLTVEQPAQPIAKHTHLVLHFDSFQMRFTDSRRFGGVFWLGRCATTNDIAGDGLGPEPLTLRPGQLTQRLSRTGRAIKNALLDQRLIAGLGNIYADEALFAARIHPLRRADRLKPAEVRRLSRAIKLTLRRALRHRGSTLRDYVDADGASGAFQRLHRVYARQGLPCAVCGARVRLLVLAGRSCHFCANCQRRRR
jgi:formamidopyrimidine-DNA glycosylase